MSGQDTLPGPGSYYQPQRDTVFRKAIEAKNRASLLENNANIKVVKKERTEGLILNGDVN